MSTPKDQTSLAGSRRLVWKRSGAVKTSVPHGALSTAPWAAGQKWASPKSLTLATKPRRSLREFMSSTLAGLRSAQRGCSVPQPRRWLRRVTPSPGGRGREADANTFSRLRPAPRRRARTSVHDVGVVQVCHALRHLARRAVQGAQRHLGPEAPVGQENAVAHGIQQAALVAVLLQSGGGGGGGGALRGG